AAPARACGGLGRSARPEHRALARRTGLPPPVLAVLPVAVSALSANAIGGRPVAPGMAWASPRQDDRIEVHGSKSLVTSSRRRCPALVRRSLRAAASLASPPPCIRQPPQLSS